MRARGVWWRRRRCGGVAARARCGSDAAIATSRSSIAEGPRPGGARRRGRDARRVLRARPGGFGAVLRSQGRGASSTEFLSRYDASHDRVLLALERRRIVGSLIVDGGETTAATHGAHLRWFVVDEAHHGRGVGKTLMAAAMDFIASARVRALLPDDLRRSRSAPARSTSARASSWSRRPVRKPGARRSTEQLLRMDALTTAASRSRASP